MRHRVAVLEQKSGVDQAGQRNGKWVVASGRSRVPCEVVFTGGGESTRTKQVEAVGAFTVRLRTLPGLSPENRLRWGTMLLEIESVGDPTGMGRELVCVCRSVV